MYREIEAAVTEERAPSRAQLCRVLNLSRAGLYRAIVRPDRRERERELRDAIQRIALQMPCYGRRSITAALKRLPWREAVNHKRVRRIMREDGLLRMRRRAFHRTTDSNHDQSSTRTGPSNWC